MEQTLSGWPDKNEENREKAVDDRRKGEEEDVAVRLEEHNKKDD